MSVSPAQNFSKPPPVPEVPTVICTSGCSSLNSSAAACANGATVDDPSMLILPESCSPPDSLCAADPPPAAVLVSSSSPQAVTPNARAPAATAAVKARILTCALLLEFLLFDVKGV